MLKRYTKKNHSFAGIEIEDAIISATEKEAAAIEKPIERKGLNIFWYTILVLILLLFGRIFYLGIIRGSYYSDLSKNNRIRSIVIQAPRGKIIDKFGQILVKNVPSIDAVIIPRYLPEDYGQRRTIAQTVSSIINMDEGNIEVAIESQDRKSLDPILLKENISEDEALILSEKAKNLPGIDLENTAIREYQDSTILSSVIGYDGKITKEELNKNKNYMMTDYIGKTGLEKYYEKELKGKNGAKQVEVDSVGNIKKNLGVIDAVAGNDLVLNIDEGLQKKLYDSISNVLEQTGTKTAAAVAIDPRNGGVLALISMPSYDNNLFARSISSSDYNNLIGDKNLPLFNRVVSGEYPPGSTFKPALAVAALSEGTINASTTVGCSGGISIGSWHFGDWKTHGGGIDVKKAIAESCDVFFYSIGGGYGNIPGLGMDRIKEYADLFGFGSISGLDLPGEASGFIPSEDWKIKKLNERWYIGDSYHSSIGQGFITATPIQLVNYVASIANGGTLYSPKVVNSIKFGDGQEKKINPEIIRRNFIPNNILQIVKEGMRQTVTGGTAQSLNSLPVEVAGKTGTAQFGSENKTHGWFVSFAPYDNPKIAMVVLVEGGGEGSSTALPITREVLDWYFANK